MKREIIEYDGVASESGFNINIKLRNTSKVFHFRTKYFEPYRFGIKDVYPVLFIFLIYNFFLLFLVRTSCVQYCFGFFSFFISMINGGCVLLALSFNRDFKEWHGAEHKLIALLKNRKNISIADFQDSSRVSINCGSRDILWKNTLFIYCAMIILLDKITQYFTGGAYGWIIFIALFCVFFDQYKKICDNWFWWPAQKYLLTAEPCKEKTEEALEFGLRIKNLCNEMA